MAKIGIIGAVEESRAGILTSPNEWTLLYFTMAASKVLKERKLERCSLHQVPARLPLLALLWCAVCLLGLLLSALAQKGLYQALVRPRLRNSNLTSTLLLLSFFGFSLESYISSHPQAHACAFLLFLSRPSSPACARSSPRILLRGFSPKRKCTDPTRSPGPNLLVLQTQIKNWDDHSLGTAKAVILAIKESLKRNFLCAEAFSGHKLVQTARLLRRFHWRVFRGKRATASTALLFDLGHSRPH